MKYCDILHRPLCVDSKSCLVCIYLFWGHRRQKEGSSEAGTVILGIRELENLLHITKGLKGEEWPCMHLSITLQPTCFQFIIGMCQWLIHLAVWKRVLMRPRSEFSFPYRQILLVRESFSFSHHRLNPSSAQLPYRYVSWMMRGQVRGCEWVSIKPHHLPW